MTNQPTNAIIFNSLSARCSSLSVCRRVFASSTAYADDIKIGFVDIPFLIDQAPQSLAASDRLETEFAPRQALIKKHKLELEELREELDDVSLDAAQKKTIEREYRKTERRMKRDEQEFREELNIQKNQEFKRVRVYVLDAIATFAKSHNYDMIISDGVLYANKTVDVTDKVLQELQLSLQTDDTTPTPNANQ